MSYDVMAGKFGCFYVNPANNGIDESDSASLTRMNTRYPDEYAVMQFTGLHDRRGKEIYEGDVFKLSEGHPRWISKNMVVSFYEGAFCIEIMGHDYAGEKPTAFITYFDGCENHGLKEPYSKFIEVIGNIYENPELIN